MQKTVRMYASEAWDFGAELTKAGYDQHWTPVDENGMVTITWPAVEGLGKQIEEEDV